MLVKHLYSIFAERWYRGGSIWFYSDPHFGDPEMVEIRKNYISDDEQVRRINSKVGKNDTLIILGDVGDVEYVKKLRGYKVLITGNHDKGATTYLRQKRIVPSSDVCPHCGGAIVCDRVASPNMGPNCRWCEQCGTVVLDTVEEDNHLFDEVYEGPLMISDRIILTHEPIVLSPQYMFNIHGHDHAHWYTGCRHLNCCAEHINYTPVSLKEIINNGALKDVESIHRHTIDEAIVRKLLRKARNHEQNPKRNF